MRVSLNWLQQYIDGSSDFPGTPPPAIVEDLVISKYYLALETWREQDVLDVVSDHEPGFETHIFNRFAGRRRAFHWSKW